MSSQPRSIKKSNFPSYGELISGLVKGVEAVGFFRPDEKCEWISVKKAGLKLGMAVKESLRTGKDTRHVDNEDSVTFSLPLRNREGIVCILALTVSMNDSDTWDMSIERIKSVLKPVLTVLTSELASRLPEPKSKVLTERTEELEWLFSVTADMRSGPGDSAAVEQLLAAAVQRMDAAFGGLAITEKRLNVTYSSPKNSDPSAAVAYQQTHPHLMSFVQRQKKPMVLNKPLAARSDMGRHKVMAIPVTSQGGKVVGLIAFFKPGDDKDFGRREQYLGRHIARQLGAMLDSQFDLATGLYTRLAFEQQVIQHLEKSEDRINSMAYIDIDELHVVNETLGYEAGDEIIVRVAEMLQPPLLPSNAIAARPAGDRFLLFLPGHDTTNAQQCIQNLQKQVANLSVSLAGKPIAISMSCGISRLLEMEQPVARGIAAAELACKTAKERGRNRTEVYLDVDESMMKRRSDITGLGRLRKALEDGRFEIFAQKIVAAGATTTTAGMECLVRMRDEDGALIPPADFISTAHRYRLLKEIDAWVIQNALQILSPHASMLLHSGMYASINISGQSLSDANMLAQIADWIRASQVPPGRITFEITETAAVSNLPLADKLMRGLRRMGCRFALDDFGTGVNSLSYLKSLQVQCVKIDGSFVRDIITNQRSAAMVSAIVQLAKSMEIACVAEFVESSEILERLTGLGVEFAQGYYVHKPESLKVLLESVAGDHTGRLGNIGLYD